MGNLILYHNTSNQNAISISKEGIKGGMRLSAYGKGSEAEGAGIWCTSVRGYGYGGATITFQIDDSERELRQQNDTEYIVYRDIKPEEIIDIDLVISDIPCSYKRKDSINSTVESDIPDAINQWGKDKLLEVFKKNPQHFAEPYNYEQLVHLIETGNKLLKGSIQLTESKKLEEESKNSIASKELSLIKYIFNKDNNAKDFKYDDTRNKNPKLEFIYNNMPIRVVYLPRYKSSPETYGYVVYINSNPVEKEGYFKADYNKVCEYIKKYNMPVKSNTDTSTDVNLNKDYDNDESVTSKLGKEKGLEHFYESKKLEEAGRNELLALAKGETITRYNKSAGYKGFSLVDIDTTAIMTRDSIVVTNRVGNYYDTIELEDILYWVGYFVEESRDKKMGIKIAEKALLGAADGMDIKIDCSCPDFAYRFAYQATILEYKYGKPETRPAKITNPNNYGSMCKHLIAMLSNKQWLRQVASTLNDWVIENIEWVRKFLNVKEEDFQVPDEVARELGRHGAYAKFIDKNMPPEEEENQDDEELEEIDDEENDENNNNEENNEELEEIDNDEQNNKEDIDLGKN